MTEQIQNIVVHRIEGKTNMTLLRKIELYLRVSGMAPTRFGRTVAGDPRLVFDLRRGREAGPKLCARINSYLIEVAL